MSAIEWLHFINPIILIMLVVSLIASVPIPTAWCKKFALATKPLAFKKTLFITLGFIALGWTVAAIAPHITTPLVRVNVMAASQLILTIALTLVAAISITRLFQRNNLLSLSIVLLKNHLPILAKAVSLCVAAFAVIFVRSLDDNSYKKTQNEDSDLSDEEKVLIEHNINLNGDYCDKDKTNWYQCK